MIRRIPDIQLMRFLRSLAMISGFFAILICFLIIITYFQLQHTDPLNTPVLKAMQEKLIQHPEDGMIRQQIRELDLLARKSYFTSQWQIRTGGYILIVSLLILVISIKWQELIRPDLPLIPLPDEGNFWSGRKIRRRWIAAAGLVFIGFALFLAFLTHRMIGEQEAVVNSAIPVAHMESSQPSPPVPAGPAVPGDSQTGSSARPPDTVAAKPGIKESRIPSVQENRANYPGFRGPGGNGTDYHRHIPVSWNGPSGKNILWKTEIPLPGNNSPVLWGGRVFLSGATENRREVYCLDLYSGKILWTAKVAKLPASTGEVPKVTADAGLSAPTLTTDGQRVYAIFANGDLVALDFDGKPAWSKNLGLPKNHYGHSSSLIMFRDLLIIQYDQTGGAKVIALSGRNGEKVWEVPRDVKVSWASPVVVNTGSRDELILAAEPDVISYEPATGKELWKLDCISGEVGPSVTYSAGMVFSINEYSKLAAIRLGNPPVLAWEDNDYLSDVPSPVANGPYLFVVTSYGTIVCYDAATGKKYWIKEMGNPVYSSPVITEGKLYIIDKKGIMHIFRVDKDMVVMGEPALGEGSVCTPAFSDGRIVIRGNKHLYCIVK
jgi:outer membrane protein assembly factor BamB